MPRAGSVIWGARTRRPDTAYRYVPVRRTAIFLRTSIYANIQWAVFEPNTPPLWQKLKRSIGAFLTQQWRDGALFGQTAEEAFFPVVAMGNARFPRTSKVVARVIGDLSCAFSLRPRSIRLRSRSGPPGIERSALAWRNRIRVRIESDSALPDEKRNASGRRVGPGEGNMIASLALALLAATQAVVGVDDASCVLDGLSAAERSKPVGKSK